MKEVFIWFTEDGKIRKWSESDFENSTRYVSEKHHPQNQLVKSLQETNTVLLRRLEKIQMILDGEI